MCPRCRPCQSMLILFDNGTPAPLRHSLKGHVVVEAIDRANADPAVEAIVPPVKLNTVLKPSLPDASVRRPPVMLILVIETPVL